VKFWLKSFSVVFRVNTFEEEAKYVPEVEDGKRRQKDLEKCTLNYSTLGVGKKSLFHFFVLI